LGIQEINGDFDEEIAEQLKIKHDQHGKRLMLYFL
jgi:hypothetical protein